MIYVFVILDRLYGTETMGKGEKIDCLPRHRNPTTQKGVYLICRRQALNLIYDLGAPSPVIGAAFLTMSLWNADRVMHQRRH